jgi:hypothetical protein
VDGQLTPLEVALGESDDTGTEVFDGVLKAGQQVIVGAAFSEERTSLLPWGW